MIDRPRRPRRRRLTLAQARAHVLAGVATSFDPTSGWDPTEFLGLDDRSPDDQHTLYRALYLLVAELFERAGDAPQARRSRDLAAEHAAKRGGRRRT